MFKSIFLTYHDSWNSELVSLYPVSCLGFATILLLGNCNSCWEADQYHGVRDLVKGVDFNVQDLPQEGVKSFVILYFIRTYMCSPFLQVQSV